MIFGRTPLLPAPGAEGGTLEGARSTELLRAAAPAALALITYPIRRILDATEPAPRAGTRPARLTTFH
jgi:hypothetical protein